MAEIFNTQVDLIQDYQIVRHITTDKGSYAVWMGAGISREAGIKTAGEICNALRQDLAKSAKPKNQDVWATRELNWDDPRRRYSTCLKKYGAAAARVKYFRGLIQGLSPVFGHHAATLLMQAGFLSKTCLTTNFDKLIEIAFAQQGNSECQAIRGDEEANFWRQEEDKCYVIKLHGDYDTHNILNTNDETAIIPKQLGNIVHNALRQRGLVVIGSSGYEDSVVRLFDDLLRDEDSTILNMGLYWGVYISDPKVADPIAIEQQMQRAIMNGAVNKDILEIMARNKKDRPCAFFPVWGAGNFFFDVVKATENRAVVGRAERYLDHTMRLQHIFAQGGLTATAISTRLNKLEQKKASARWRDQNLNMRAQNATRVWTGKGRKSGLTLEILYGDITSRSLMDSGTPLPCRRAVVSPEDNFISASGGAALELLSKAGSHMILNELSKFSEVKHRQVVVTSGGELPVNYIFHATATKLDQDGSSKVTPDDILVTVESVLNTAFSLQVDAIFVPLIGSGEGIKPEESLDAILQASKAFAIAHPDYKIHISVVILDEGMLARKNIGTQLADILNDAFEIKNTFEHVKTAP
jgi:O-acetyl-ADP-ribose deacetylase (regulator of RNase III)